MRPRLTIDLSVIAANTARVMDICRPQGVEVWGVTKAACGNPAVARAMLRGGATGLADSRLDNIRRMRRGGIDAPVMMLRLPSMSEAADVVRLTEISLNSEAATLRALGEAAVDQGVIHGVLVMLELGDRREGASAEELPRLCAIAGGTDGLRLAGIGANFMCANGVLPSLAKMEALVEASEAVERALGVRVAIISGGNSANLPEMAVARLPHRVNHLRVGAAILRGENPLTGGTLPGMRDDAFLLEAELVELKDKPSAPDGMLGRDAFGGVPVILDRGTRRRGIVNLGRVDISAAGLAPRTPGAEVISASSDHLLIDLTDAAEIRVGDRVSFGLDYGALVQAMLSPYVDKVLAGRGAIGAAPRRIEIDADPVLLARPEVAAFRAALPALGFDGGGGAVLRVLITADRPDRLPDLPGELGVLWCDSDPGPVAMLPAESGALYGLRTATPGQAAMIRERGLLALTMEEIDMVGVRETIRRALGRVTGSTDGFHLVLHASLGRGMDADPLEAGLNWRECSMVMERIAASRGLRTITLAGLGAESSGAALAVAFGHLLSALGKRILPAG